MVLTDKTRAIDTFIKSFSKKGKPKDKQIPQPKDFQRIAIDEINFANSFIKNLTSKGKKDLHASTDKLIKEYFTNINNIENPKTLRGKVNSFFKLFNYIDLFIKIPTNNQNSSTHRFLNKVVKINQSRKDSKQKITAKSITEALAKDGINAFKVEATSKNKEKQVRTKAKTKVEKTINTKLPEINIENLSTEQAEILKFRSFMVLLSPNVVADNDRIPEKLELRLDQFAKTLPKDSKLKQLIQSLFSSDDIQEIYNQIKNHMREQLKNTIDQELFFIYKAGKGDEAKIITVDKKYCKAALKVINKNVNLTQYREFQKKANESNTEKYQIGGPEIEAQNGFYDGSHQADISYMEDLARSNIDQSFD